MSACWKCGKELPEGETEHDFNCRAGASPASLFPSDEEIKAALARVNNNTAHIDWEKVGDFEALKQLVRAWIGDRIYFPHGFPAGIKPFLKEGE